MSEFGRILDQEYINLSDHSINEFGLSLIDSGSEQVITVNTLIGNQPILRVLSEGEQKIHALSVFFAELFVSNPNIIVFDDPVNSFDYNYSNLFVERLKDYIVNNTHKQIIILTHNWDFFVFIQQVLNGANLNNFIQS